MTFPRKSLTAAEAAAALGISQATLYAYVSRGRVRKVRDSADGRTSRYSAADVDALRQRKAARRNPDIAARETLAWGLPVLESSITLIHDGHLYYRGRDVVSLVTRATFEQVVSLLWRGVDAANGERFPATSPPAWSPAQTRLRQPILRMQAMLPLLGARDRCDIAVPSQVIACGRRIVAALAAATGDVGRSGPLGQRLATGWRRETPTAARTLDLALTLCADHELNASTFAVRVAASAGASPYDAVAAGLAALRGPRHGGDTDRVEAMLDEMGASAALPASLSAAIAHRARSGAATPGFGHPLYPDGDPRASLMIETVLAYWPDSAAATLARAVRSSRVQRTAGRANLDLGLVLVRRALGLPRGAALALFALGRTAGWIAHAMEQYERAQLIRPRAVYMGPPPTID